MYKFNEVPSMPSLKTERKSSPSSQGFPYSLLGLERPHYLGRADVLVGMKSEVGAKAIAVSSDSGSLWVRFPRLAPNLGVLDAR